ncbi:MAG: hypothetical protein Q7T57_08980 [Dehalococcoidales bacterium]|nr:hypothetical protein [Dehalococcoidales bacterium]
MAEFLKFDKCRVCGSEETVCDQVVKSEREKGNFKSDFHPSFARLDTPIFDPTQKVFFKKRVPALVAFLDICATCGCVRATRIDLGEAEITPMQRGVKGG